MRINHINLTVPDVAKAREFFEEYFGLRRLTERGGNAIAVLGDGAGFVFTLSNFEKATEVTYPGAFHVGFMQDSREQVDAMFGRLRAGGFDPEPPRDYHGAWTFYFKGPGGIVVEVGHQYKWI